MTRQQEREHFDRLLALREQYATESHEPGEPITAVIGEVLPTHTYRRGQPIPLTGVPYGTTHDRDCPACEANGASWGCDPRSEAYWSA